ncbi:MAG: bifunctional phosphopantothenoylcysteine decarboxylase/phosphopantothenate--cysteine ligase CoaBC [Halobacteria archaeon]|nr:bifunctional phosphopantothenoylcysteine decarboxylase/phosphopantothenate--cysteine ligase CoaBC [Halobacteria archaeon]
MTLDGKTVAFGVTGSIAAVECVKIIHELRRRGAEVHAVMTESAQKIVHEWALEFASGNPVITEITGEVEHVDLCGTVESDFESIRGAGSGSEGEEAVTETEVDRSEDSFRDTDAKADLFLVAPATANTVGKIANGIDDTTVTTFATTALGSGLPVLIAPAMHEPMYDHPGVIENLDKLDDWGVGVIPPKIEEDKAKLADKEDIAMECERFLSHGPLEGKRVVVTSGRTEEAVDPVRVLTTRSSGKMGRAIAEEAYVRGADVSIVHNYDDEVRYADSVEVESAHEMIDAALEEVEEGCDIFVSAAAISDYTVDTSDSKISSGKDLVLDMEKVPKLIDQVRDEVPDAYIVGFKAETGLDEDDLVGEAEKVMERASLDLIVANDASVMGDDETSVRILGVDGVETQRGSKTEVAKRILDEVEGSLEG